MSASTASATRATVIVAMSLATAATCAAFMAVTSTTSVLASSSREVKLARVAVAVEPVGMLVLVTVKAPSKVTVFTIGAVSATATPFSTWIVSFANAAARPRSMLGSVVPASS